MYGRVLLLSPHQNISDGNSNIRGGMFVWRSHISGFVHEENPECANEVSQVHCGI
jgi:hypothetical protein